MNMENTAVLSNRKMASRKPLLGIFAVFLLPLMAAYWLLLSPSKIADLNNQSHGLWLKNEQTLMNDEHKWLVLATENRLTNDLQKTLESVHQLLGKNKDRVEIQWLEEDIFSEIFNQAEWSAPNMKQTINPLVFLADPKGVVLMGYSVDQIGSPLLSDIKHLLKHNPK